MSSLERYWKYLKESYKIVLENFPTYLPSYIAFLMIDLLAIFPWEALGYESQSFPEVMASILVGILSLIAIVNVVLIEKAKAKHREKEKLAYAVPTYLIYTLYSTIALLVAPGVFFLAASALKLPSYAIITLSVLPGIIGAVCVGMVPLASVLIDNDSVNYFKLSLNMARLDPVIIFCFGVVSILIEVPSMAFDYYLGDWVFRTGANFLYSIFDSAIMVVVTVASVRVFYHLKHRLNDQSQ